MIIGFPCKFNFILCTLKHYTDNGSRSLTKLPKGFIVHKRTLDLVETSVLQGRKRAPRDGNSLVCGHTAGQWKSWAKAEVLRFLVHCLVHSIMFASCYSPGEDWYKIISFDMNFQNTFRLVVYPICPSDVQPSGSPFPLIANQPSPLSERQKVGQLLTASPPDMLGRSWRNVYKFHGHWFSLMTPSSRATNSSWFGQNFPSVCIESPMTWEAPPSWASRGGWPPSQSACCVDSCSSPLGHPLPTHHWPA